MANPGPPRYIKPMPEIEDAIEVSSGDMPLDGAEGEPQTGPAAIARYVKHLGTGPGVYRMIDKAGEVIYALQR